VKNSKHMETDKAGILGKSEGNSLGDNLMSCNSYSCKSRDELIENHMSNTAMDSVRMSYKQDHILCKYFLLDIARRDTAKDIDQKKAREE